jgi:large subunit ribosomal protein L4
MIDSKKITQAVSSYPISAEDIGLVMRKKTLQPQAFALCVRSLLQGWRQGTVYAKGRSDVSLTNKKPWKQKGTGRARAGSARSPLWRGGGVIFGPQERVRQLKVNKKIRKAVLSTVLSDYVEKQKIIVLDWQLQGEIPKTSQAHNALKQVGLAHNKIVLFALQKDMLTYASFANIPTVSLFYFDQPNVFNLVNNKQWVVLQKDIEHFKEMVSKWN